MSEQGLHVAHMTEAPLGGVLTYLQHILSDQAADSIFQSIHLLVPEENIEPLQPFKTDRVTLHSFKRKGRSPSEIARLAHRTIRFIHDVKPDILHLHSSFAGAIGRIASHALSHRPKIVYSPHTFAFVRHVSRVERRMIAAIERGLSLITDRIICDCDYTKDRAVSAGIAPEKCTVIYNAIRPPEAPPERRNEFGESSETERLKVLFVGRFDRQKGFDIFLDVMAQLRDRADGLAVGGYILDNGEKPPIPDNVTILGWRTGRELQNLYFEADLLLMPSRWDGLALVLLEAMRAGLPVFASCTGGLREVVQHGSTGFLFDLENPTKVVDLIRSTSRDALRQYGMRGYELFKERFTSDTMSRRTTELYLSLV